MKYLFLAMLTAHSVVYASDNRETLSVFELVACEDEVRLIRERFRVTGIIFDTSTWGNLYEKIEEKLKSDHDTRGLYRITHFGKNVEKEKKIKRNSLGNQIPIVHLKTPQSKIFPILSKVRLIAVTLVVASVIIGVIFCYKKVARQKSLKSRNSGIIQNNSNRNSRNRNSSEPMLNTAK